MGKRGKSFPLSTSQWRIGRVQYRETLQILNRVWEEEKGKVSKKEEIIPGDTPKYNSPLGLGLFGQPGGI